MEKYGILKAMKLCLDYEKLDTEQRQALRDRRLKQLAAYVRENSPFFRELYREVPETFHCYV